MMPKTKSKRAHARASTQQEHRRPNPPPRTRKSTASLRTGRAEVVQARDTFGTVRRLQTVKAKALNARILGKTKSKRKRREASGVTERTCQA